MEKNGVRLASAEMEALVALSVSAVKGSTVGALPDGLNLKRLYKLAKSNYITGIIHPALRDLRGYCLMSLSPYGKMRRPSRRLTLLYRKGRGIVIREPSAIAIDDEKNKVISLGDDAFEIFGKEPSRIYIYSIPLGRVVVL